VNGVLPDEDNVVRYVRRRLVDDGEVDGHASCWTKARQRFPSTGWNTLVELLTIKSPRYAHISIRI